MDTKHTQLIQYFPQRIDFLFRNLILTQSFPDVLNCITMAPWQALSPSKWPLLLGLILRGIGRSLGVVLHCIFHSKTIHRFYNL